MRKLSDIERLLVEGVAERLSDAAALKLKSDLDASSVEDVLGDGSRVLFHIIGYDRPPYSGQHQYPVEIRLFDVDGSELTAVLYADPNDRLYELEIIRWDNENLISPDIDSVVFY